jgi:tRNA threonylcarbamoyladenosine biosynthesis protein TsaE
MRKIELPDLDATHRLGLELGACLRGGECLELVGDVGAGKTTLAKGIALAMGVDEDVQSPSFTISREYEARNGLRLAHYDLYRLPDPGVVAYELDESVKDKTVVTLIEWANSVAGMLPDDRIVISLEYVAEDQGRVATVAVPHGHATLGAWA